MKPVGFKLKVDVDQWNVSHARGTGRTRDKRKWKKEVSAATKPSRTGRAKAP